MFDRRRPGCLIQVVQSITMRNLLLGILPVIWLVVSPAGVTARAETLASPDGEIVLTFSLKDHGKLRNCPVYEIAWNGRKTVSESRLGFELEDGASLVDRFEIVGIERGSGDRTWKPLYGERASIRDNYNALTISLVHAGSPVYTMNLHFRCYDQGAAFRYEFPGKDTRGEIAIRNELTHFRFTGDHEVWCVNTAQGEYEKKKISSMGDEVERPLTLKIEERRYAAIAEAGLVDFARMKLSRAEGDPRGIVSSLSGGVVASLPMKTPWRLVMLAENPGKLLENNDIFLNLNEPCAIGDTSWIKPGKVIREVTLTTAGGKACVDFAAEHGLQYVEFDAGWYGPEYRAESDARTVTVDPERSPGPLDLPEVLRYARDRDIGILLYVNRLALEKQWEEILPLYREWGVRGVKFGFVQVGSQEWTSWLHRAVRAAAGERLMVDIHDEYRPTGYSRTYPNLMTQEGIGGDETSPENSQTLTLLFTRMLAGAADNTICYYSPRVDEKATHAYQLAKAVCFYSPWQFLFWYDRPPASPGGKGGAGGVRNVIGNEPELEFFEAVPTVWDETRVICGQIGEYALIARRSGSEWFIGGMNTEEPRTLELPLAFLEEGRDYLAHVYFDDENSETRTRVKIERRPVDSGSVLQVRLGRNGGQAMRIVPID